MRLSTPWRQSEDRPDTTPAAALLRNAARPLQELLTSGGDERLALDAPGLRNAYGCKPYPQPATLDFASCTASSISEPGYARAEAAQAQLRHDAIRMACVFDQYVDNARNELCARLDVTGAEVVFAPSGTDAQLHALFLVKALLGGPIASIIVGSDQTGSGTVHTAFGRHFNARTSLGAEVEKSGAISGLSERVRASFVSFCNEAGTLRTDKEMDDAVFAAVTQAVSRGEKVLLQAMASSKLGWCAPSVSCLQAVMTAWPDKVRIVMDACQMRLSRAQLAEYLARGYFVLITGSKYFTGPAFSGALLVPAMHADAIDAIAAAPRGLAGYTTRYDWPRRWDALRQSLPDRFNYGQWLRWEATLEEMNSYFSVPEAFRYTVLSEFALQAERLIAQSTSLQLLSEHCGEADPQLAGELRHRTIFAFVPIRDGEALKPEQCSALYRAMSRNLADRLSENAPANIRATAARICQIGQPVILRHRPGAVLRVCTSARIVTECWQRAQSAPEALAPVLDDLRKVIEKLDWLLAHPEFWEAAAP
jgi:hypothetical protein